MISTTLRRWHAYIGLIIAPSVLFFAVTGALQIFNLHESHGTYRAAMLIQKLSKVHKDQVFEEPREEAAPAAAPADNASSPHPADDDDDKMSAPTLVLKWFFLIVSVGLIFSTSVGMWMGITQLRKARLAWTLILVGTVVPIVLLCV
jgi:hypothetical protein